MLRHPAIFGAVLAFTLSIGLANTQQPAAEVKPAAPAGAADETQTGLAAVYSKRLNGRTTASGQRYNQNALTAAHQTLPFGSRVKVTNTKNNRSVVVTINDRGPTQAGRILDLSPAAAARLGMRRPGLMEVKMEVVAGHGAAQRKKG